MPNLVERLRAIGLPMESRYADGRCVAWTTDRATADAARKAGARVVQVGRTNPRFSGWEVNAHEDAP